MKTDSNIKSAFFRSDVPVWLAGVVILSICILMFQPVGVNAAESQSGFNHFSTGFPLEGAHKDAQCTSCHLRGLFEGTPVTCAACHNQASQMPGDVLPQNHIQTNQMCDECHAEQFWKPLARMNHDAVIGSCAICHDGATATGKTVSHIASDNTCDDCHTTNGWVPATFDHATVTGNCSSCHNGSTATGKT
ncbi:MAG: hypothetical protein ABFS24_12755, partial [Pseudomonadota bacterium]